MISINWIGLVALLFISISLGGCWHKKCEFDNTSPWVSSTSQGIYNCICEGNKCTGATPSCNLFVKGPQAGAVFVSTGVSQMPRPTGMTGPTDDPNTYKCECE